VFLESKDFNAAPHKSTRHIVRRRRRHYPLKSKQEVSLFVKKGLRQGIPRTQNKNFNEQNNLVLTLILVYIKMRSILVTNKVCHDHTTHPPEQ
jgi:hypothetical protein